MIVKTSMISYLMYEDGEIVIDEITPKDRFGHLFTNETLWVSNSAGKSIMSYVYGHAVCRGHVDGIHQTMNWDILENTLYEVFKRWVLQRIVIGVEAIQCFINNCREILGA